jgi:hypothetical protein
VEYASLFAFRVAKVATSEGSTGKYCNKNLRLELDGGAAGFFEVELLACLFLSVPAIAALGPPFFPIAKNVMFQNKMKKEYCEYY